MRDNIEEIVRCGSFSDNDGTTFKMLRAEFLQDFGPWKKGHFAQKLFVDYDSGYIIESDKDGEDIEQCAVKLVVEPVSE